MSERNTLSLARLRLHAAALVAAALLVNAVPVTGQILYGSIVGVVKDAQADPFRARP